MSLNEEPPAEEAVFPETKRSIRKKVWDFLDTNDLCNFPRPVSGRIPNFKKAEEAAQRLIELDVFKSAKVIKINPDKPQEPVRFLALEAKKSVLVPIPRLRTGLFQLVELPADAGNRELKIAASRRGAEHYGKPLPMDSDIRVDIIVLGAVAVSRDGHRIGKGEGFADLEYAMMAGMGAITPSTIVITTVDDSQVFPTLPEDMFEPFDVPVDIIVTPTQVIHVTPRLAKPTGLIWNILSSRRLNAITVLKTIRDAQMAAGSDCILKDVDSDVEERPPRQTNGRLRNKRRVRSAKSTSADENGVKSGDEDGKAPRERPPRSNNRRRTRKPKESGDGVDTGDEKKEQKPERRPRRSLRNRQRPPIEFSLRVGNIATDVRVRDLKAALAERGVKPTDITWRGHRGFAFLHFANAKPTKDPPLEPVTPVDSNSIVASLQDLKVSAGEGGEETMLKVEPAKPVTRIETTDITAV